MIQVLYSVFKLKSLSFPCCLVLCVLNQTAGLCCSLWLHLLNCMSVSSKWPNVICTLKNMRPVLTRLKSHCGPGVRKVKELPLRSDLSNNTRGEGYNNSIATVYPQLQKPTSRPVNLSHNDRASNPSKSTTVNTHESARTIRIFRRPHWPKVPAREWVKLMTSLQSIRTVIKRGTVIQGAVVSWENIHLPLPTTASASCSCTNVLGMTDKDLLSQRLKGNMTLVVPLKEASSTTKLSLDLRPL